MATKKTQKDFYNDIIKVVSKVGRTDLAEFCEGRIAVLDKKSANRSKKINEANESIKASILEVLATTEGTVTELMKVSDVLGELSNPKVTAMLRQLKDEGKVNQRMEGRKSIYSLA